ncbi:DinB family protein [Bacillus sp. AFS040349]|uniref:DinB family protein n=1 Tax=Bacillus sp. AFS040349 TaxID=2033502 RepID=UPI000BFE08C0|nr:DinB family protein [Bacillus sp. AFS040349]PGT82776.1 damage-inducible protein DinB [Bacillus sp. AFS040349]
MINKPAADEFNSYFAKYVDIVPEGDIIQLLQQQNNETIDLLKNYSETQGLFKYTPNKWSIKEVIGHLSDTERILSFTLLCIARGEDMSLHRYDKDAYIKNADFNRQSIKKLLEDFSVVRQSTLQFIKTLTSEDLQRKGTALGSEVTAKALVFILAGHELHHLKIIKEAYLGAEDFPN